MHPGDRTGSQDCRTGGLDGVKVMLVAKVITCRRQKKQTQRLTTSAAPRTPRFGRRGRWLARCPGGFLGIERRVRRPGFRRGRGVRVGGDSDGCRGQGRPADDGGASTQSPRLNRRRVGRGAPDDGVQGNCRGLGGPDDRGGAAQYAERETR